MTTSAKPVPIQIDAYAESADGMTLPRAVAAASLVAGACLLLAGRRKAALAAVAAGSAAMALEKPEMIREIWRNMPGYLRSGQDFLVRAERTVEDLRARGERIRSILTRA